MGKVIKLGSVGVPSCLSVHDAHKHEKKACRAGPHPGLVSCVVTLSTWAEKKTQQKTRKTTVIKSKKQKKNIKTFILFFKDG
jgi:hypothetical protein